MKIKPGITSAFRADIIQTYGVVLDSDEETELRAFLTEYVKEQKTERNETPDAEVVRTMTDDDIWTDVAVHAFMAGRAWQADQDMDDEPTETVPVEMNLQTMRAFIEFLQEQR